ncbi:hypothetical protein [Paraburkholderia sp. BCC1886]|uniref:hypothetical protein n=1 Tax=Paraburkholderia sp. BCC1886 TaxID=2562670 RepID=UPI0011843F7A|nr:hypothetical protein [Paraburkholderia sp. BCC1886]
MAMMYAFKKNQTSLVDRLICWQTKGPYCHVASILVDNGDGTYTIGQSLPGTGVQIVTGQTLPAADWDIVEGPGDVATATTWFTEKSGDAYDYLGLFGFVFRPFTILSRTKFWCSEASLFAAGMRIGWRMDPNSMANLCFDMKALGLL